MSNLPKGSSDLDALVPEIYAELRRLAVGAMAGERSPHTLQPTALVHEAYLRLAASTGLDPTGAGSSLWPGASCAGSSSTTPAGDGG
jgi:hypothetical protein